jgi:hypothetical protein
VKPGRLRISLTASVWQNTTYAGCTARVPKLTPGARRLVTRRARLDSRVRAALRITFGWKKRTLCY